jgi:hypothetical protein
MKNHSWLNFMMFTCFLVIGYTYSTRFYQHDYGILTSTSKALADNQNSLETMPNGQRSFMLIAASAINTPAPQLESIWLASYFPSDTTIRIMPVFPSGGKAATSFDDQLSQSFRLSRYHGSLVLDQGFIDLLADNNYWWSGYFIFDEIALAKITHLIADIEPVGGASSTAQEGNDSPEPQAVSLDIFSAQVSLLQSACQEFIKTSRDADLSQLISLLSDHFLTNLEAGQIELEWDTLYSNDHNPSCRFPTLEISRLEP